MTTQHLSTNETIHGCIDGLNAGILNGWIHDPRVPNESQHFSVEIDGSIITHSIAHCYREDLENHGFGTGHHGFFVNLKLPYEQISGKLIRILDKHQQPIPQLEYRVIAVENPVQFTLVERQKQVFKFKVTCTQPLPTTTLYLRYGEACIDLKNITLPEGESHLSVNIPLVVIDGFSDFFAIELDGYPAPLWIAKLLASKHHQDINSEACNSTCCDDFLVNSRHNAFSVQAKKNSDKQALNAALVAYQYLLSPSQHFLTYSKPAKPDISIFIFFNSDINVSQLLSTLASIILAYNSATFELVLLLSKKQERELYKVLSKHNVAYRVLINDNISSYKKLFHTVKKHAKGRYSVMINTPIEAKQNWLDELVAPMQQSISAPQVTTPKEISLAGDVFMSAPFIDINGKRWFMEQCVAVDHPSVNYNKQNTRSDTCVWCVSSSFWSEIKMSESSTEDSLLLNLKAVLKNSTHGLNVQYTPQAEVISFTSPVIATKLSTSSKKKRVLLIDHAVPALNQDAGSYAAIQEIKLIQSLGFDIIFVDACLSGRSSNTRYLQSLGVEVVYSPFYLAMEEVIHHYLPEVSAVYITRYHVAERLLPIIKRVDAKCPIIFNNADLHFLRELRFALKNNNEHNLHQAYITRDRELAVMRKVDAILSYNDTEHAVIASHLFESDKIHTCPWVLEDKTAGLRFSKRQGIAFLGGYNHAPNVEAVVFFVENIAPLLLESAPHIHFYIYGSNMPDSFNKFTLPNVKVMGFVEKLDDLFHKHRIFVAPLLSGAGIKGKVLDSLAYGLPTVLSKVAAEGLNVTHNITTLEANKPEEWSKQIQRLYKDKTLWDRISKNQKMMVQDKYSYNEGQRLMKAIFSSIGLSC